MHGIPKWWNNLQNLGLHFVTKLSIGRDMLMKNVLFATGNKNLILLNAPLTSFHFSKRFLLSLFFQEDFSNTKKALYQSRCLSKVYGPLFIKEFWVPPPIRIFSKTEFIAGSVNKQRWTKEITLCLQRTTIINTALDFYQYCLYFSQLFC